ncbi:MAG: tRNA pseudouridine(38-40) synthase TruA [Thermoanaerobaculia bacterium]
MVHRLTLSYRGTRYAGWQRQANADTVQQRVEEALGALLGTPVRIVGAGRTDAGVHARGQVASFELGREFPGRGLIHGTNHHLPDDIRVLAAGRAPDSFHARKSARAKEYRYRLVREAVLSPLDSPFAVLAPRDLDLGALRRATGLLPGEHDFTAFALAGGSHRSPVRRIRSARWVEDGAVLELWLVGNGFLRGMVRGLVGTLLEVGRGVRTVDSFARLLAGRPREDAGPTAPAHGLVLHHVEYGGAGETEDGSRPPG